MPRKPAKHPAKPKRGKKLEIEEPGVLYGRYSSHNQKDISVEQQFEKGYELAAEYGIRIIDTYADRAVSGRTDKRRDFQRMMTDAAKGKFRYVIAWKSNRMGRNMLEALINEARLQDLGVRVLYVEEDFDDTAAGRFAARSMMNVNQFYSENMAEDIKRGLYDNAANCMVANGHLPYGYKADETLHYAIDEPKAAVIREIFTRVSCGEAFVDIMASLNARGIKTSYGRPWGRSSFQRILSNERYRGIYIYGDVRKEGGIPRIVSDELYFKVQEVITTKKNPQGRHRVNGDYLLTGKLFCGHCKSPMTGISGTSRSGNLHYYYVCQKRRTEKTCEKKNLRRDDIELQVAKAIKRRTLDDDTINWIADSVVEYSQHQESASGIGLLEDQLKDTQRSIKNLMAAIEQGIITPTTKARLMELEKEQSDIDRKITMAKADVIPVNRDQLVGWLKKLQAGDVHDKKYQAELFDTFLIAVYVYDNPDGQDYMKVVFNYAGSKNTVEIPLDPSVIDNVENIETGAVRLSSAQVHQKYRLPVWVVGIFYAFSRRERSGHALPSPRGEGAERSEADEVERSRPSPVPPVVPPNPTTPHPSRRTAVPPSPQGEGLQAPLWLHRCSDALGEAVYTPPHTPGAPSRAASSRRDRPLTSVSKQSAHTVSPPRTHGHRYASAHDGSGAKHTSHRRICVPPPFICKVIMHLDNFLHQFILVRIICQAVFLRLHKNRARLFLHARRVLLF